VTLRNVTIAEVIKRITDWIPACKHVRAIYGAITKSNNDGSQPDDATHATSDENLTNFLMAANGVYRLIILQVELIRDGGGTNSPT